MKVLAALGRDAEGLLHKTVGLVSVSVWLVVLLVLVTRASRVWRLALAAPLGASIAASPLSLHFPVREEAPRHTTRAP